MLGSDLHLGGSPLIYVCMNEKAPPTSYQRPIRLQTVAIHENDLAIVARNVESFHSFAALFVLRRYRDESLCQFAEAFMLESGIFEAFERTSLSTCRFGCWVGFVFVIAKRTTFDVSCEGASLRKRHLHDAISSPQTASSRHRQQCL